MSAGACFIKQCSSDFLLTICSQCHEHTPVAVLLLLLLFGKGLRILGKVIFRILGPEWTETLVQVFPVSYSWRHLDGSNSPWRTHCSTCPWMSGNWKLELFICSNVSFVTNVLRCSLSSTGARNLCWLAHLRRCGARDCGNREGGNYRILFLLCLCLMPQAPGWVSSPQPGTLCSQRLTGSRDILGLQGLQM